MEQGGRGKGKRDECFMAAGDMKARYFLKNGFPGDFFHREWSVFLGMACRCPLRSVFRRLFRRTAAGGDPVPDGAFL